MTVIGIHEMGRLTYRKTERQESRCDDVQKAVLLGKIFSTSLTQTKPPNVGTHGKPI